MKSKLFTIALAVALVALACAIAGASPPTSWSGYAVATATADNLIESLPVATTARPSGLNVNQIEAAPAPITDLSFDGTLGVTAGPIMTSHPNAMDLTATRTSALASNPQREPEVVDLRRQNQTLASTTYSYGLERGARPVVNHPLRS